MDRTADSSLSQREPIELHSAEADAAQANGVDSAHTTAAPVAADPSVAPAPAPAPAAADMGSSTSAATVAGGSLSTPLLRDVELLGPHKWADREAQNKAGRRSSEVTGAVGKQGSDTVTKRTAHTEASRIRMHQPACAQRCRDHLALHVMIGGSSGSSWTLDGRSLDYTRTDECKRTPLQPPPLQSIAPALSPPLSRSRYGSFTSPLPASAVASVCAPRPSSSLGPTALAPSSSPPLLPAHLIPFSYQRGAATLSPQPPTEQLTTNPAVKPSSHQQQENNNATFNTTADESGALAPPIDVLAPPLDSALQSKLYSFTKLDYLSHLNDLLRLRVLAAIMFLLAILIWHYFAQNNWLVILACCYVIVLSGVAIRGSYRADKRWVDFYWMGLLAFVILYLGSFLIYMAVVGVAPTARDRCSVPSFVAAYGSGCASPAKAPTCFNRCVWELRINLAIETLLVWVAVLACLLALLWDALRLSKSLQLWSMHPCTLQWHSELSLSSKYADLSAVHERYAAEEERERRAAARQKRKERRESGDDDEDEDNGQEEEGWEDIDSDNDDEADAAAESGKPKTAAKARISASTGRTYGSGAVGTAESTATAGPRGKAPLTALYREQQSKDSSEQKTKEQ